MKLFIQLNAILFLLYGIGFMLFPAYVSQIVTDTFPDTSSAMIDMRATYGGISVGYGLFLLFIVRKDQHNKLGLLSIMLIVGGMALGRVIGIVLDASPNIIMYVFLVLEIVVVAIGARLYTRQTPNP